MPFRINSECYHMRRGSWETFMFFCMISGLGLHITFEPELSGHSVLSGRLSEPRNCYPSFTVIFISTKRSPLWAVAHKYIKWSFMTLNSGSLKFSPFWNLYRAVKLYLAVTTPKYGFYCKCFKNKCYWHVKTLIYSILKIKWWPSFRLDSFNMHISKSGRVVLKWEHFRLKEERSFLSPLLCMQLVEWVVSRLKFKSPLLERKSNF